MSSLCLGMGGESTGYPPVRGLDLASLAQARNVVLLVIDGLGYHYLKQRAADSELFRHCHRSLTSVCPTTTTSAIPTFLTGRAPLQHGLTGWFTYFSEYGAVLTVLPFSTRIGQMPIDERLISPQQLTGQAPLFDQLPVASHLVMPDWIASSSFNRAFTGKARCRPYKGLKGMFNAIVSASRVRGERNYIYAYWPEYDALAHHHGVESPEVEAHLRQLDQAFAALVQRLKGSDTLVLVTADHGFIDTTSERTLRLQAHPQLAQTLMAPLCGEPRLAFCYVHPDRVIAFEQYVANTFAREVTLISRQQMLDEGWFGLGAAHPRLADRIGHYALVMNENYTISGTLPGERPLQHIGVHGGLSLDEMDVPLIYLEI